MKNRARVHFIPNLKDGEFVTLRTPYVLKYQFAIYEDLFNYGTTTTEEAPSGERFLDNRKFEGTIKNIIDDATAYVMASMRKGSLIRGVTRQDIPEYPEVALREAIVNAVAYRDYSNFVRGSHIQIRMFADRLEVENPGGLYGGVTINKLQEGQSTRNRLLVQLMEDVHLVENRGSGIDAMLDSMQKRGLPSPVFEDKRASFLVKFYQIKPGSLAMSSAELKILAYIKEHGSIKRAEAQAFDNATKLNPVSFEARNNKGNALSDLGNYDDAIKAYDEAIRLDPKYAHAWSNKGSALSNLGKYDEAIKAYDEAIRLDPKYAHAWSNKGNALDKQGRYDEAIHQAYDEAIRLDPNYAIAWANKGNAFEALGNTTEANAAFTKANELGYTD